MSHLCSFFGVVCGCVLWHSVNQCCSVLRILVCSNDAEPPAIFVGQLLICHVFHVYKYSSHAVRSVVLHSFCLPRYFCSRLHGDSNPIQFPINFTTHDACIERFLRSVAPFSLGARLWGRVHFSGISIGPCQGSLS